MSNKIKETIIALLLIACVFICGYYLGITRKNDYICDLEIMYREVADELIDLQNKRCRK